MVSICSSNVCPATLKKLAIVTPSYFGEQKFIFLLDAQEIPEFTCGAAKKYASLRQDQDQYSSKFTSREQIDEPMPSNLLILPLLCAICATAAPASARVGAGGYPRGLELESGQVLFCLNRGRTMAVVMQNGSSPLTSTWPPLSCRRSSAQAHQR